MAVVETRSQTLLAVDPQPTYTLSPWLYMQFMEPLGATDASVEAGWDLEAGAWRPDLLTAARALRPTLIRWPGGIFSSYYRWREGVGPRAGRTPIANMFWGGLESNQVGTHEFIELCRAVGAEPLIAVNFEADGRARLAHSRYGGERAAGPSEAAAWVRYCNAPEHPERRAHGAAEPFDVRLWQIGNETSYDPTGFDAATSAARTRAFAQAMRAADPRLRLIGWGDSGWARTMLAEAGDQLDYLAFHHHFNSGLEHSPLRWDDFRVDPGRTWQHLMHACHSTEARLQAMRAEVAGSAVGLALTESHFALPGRNRCDVLTTWAAGVANARILNVHARHADVLKIATLADFFGTRWMNNAILLPTPAGSAPAYLLPVALVMALFRAHTGERAVTVEHAPAGLDITASRAGGRLYLHVVNTQANQPVPAQFAAGDQAIAGGRVYEIAADPMEVVTPHNGSDFATTEYALEPGQTDWLFPAASVSAVELDLADPAP
ncbi:MAG: hypothetical protein IT317_03750 [Anaerolineales bacterium]|nr:hypothetical protein [Anaerolineales bacterium]